MKTKTNDQTLEQIINQYLEYTTCSAQIEQKVTFYQLDVWIEKDQHKQLDKYYKKQHVNK